MGEGQGRSGEVQRPSEDTPKSSSTPHNVYEDIAERMEVISPGDVTLAKFLGSGGYGEVYLGKWHSSEAAIKCLNPSMFYNGDGGVVRRLLPHFVAPCTLSCTYTSMYLLFERVEPTCRHQGRC